MPLDSGLQIGPYQIVSAVGAGGMGEVYRARDTRLNREVALKVLPAEVSRDPSRRDRFEHEARVVAALNHPNIVALYDVGFDNGTSFIVTELLNGSTLRNASLPSRKIVDIAGQIADAIAAAHAAGVIHRDLKPDNIIVTSDGRAKVLDFGIAKATGPVAAAPTMAATEAGLIVGTVAYMSPEQVRGGDIDHRSDIFSFGVVLYELLSGHQPFTGETAAEVMTAVLRHDAPEMPAGIPANLRHIVLRCLEKQPDERFQSARDLAFALRQLTSASTDGGNRAGNADAGQPRTMFTRASFAAAVLIGGVAIGASISHQLSSEADNALDPIQLSRITNDLATEVDPSFSPDGRAIAYQRRFGGSTEIVVTPLAEQHPVVVFRSPGQLGRPYWHPDGTRVCYTTLRREFWCVGASGGTPQKLLPGPAGFALGGDSIFVISLQSRKRTLARSSPPGATPQPIDTITLPDGPLDVDDTAVSPDASKLLLRSNDALWLVQLPTGDPQKLRLSPNSTALAAAWFPDSRHALVVERNSSLRAYHLVMLDTRSDARRLVRHDTGAIISTALSTDGQRIAYSSGPVSWDIVEFTLDGAHQRAVVTSGDLENTPSWSPKGDRFAYIISGVGTRASLWTRRADGSDPFPLATDVGVPVSPRYSPDGERVAYVNGSGLHTVPAGGGRAVRILSYQGTIPRFCWSSDGEWLWYQHDGVWKVPSQGGQPSLVKAASLADCSANGEVLIGVPGQGAQLIRPDGEVVRTISKAPLSTAGLAPTFAEGGKTVFALRTDLRSIDVVDVQTGMVLRVIEFDLDPADTISSFSVHPDGKRILLQAGGLRYDLWLAEGFAQPARGWRRWFRHWDVSAVPTGTDRFAPSD